MEIKDLDNIKEPMFGAALLSALLMFSPGISYLFIYGRWTFTSLDILKILSLSLAILAPFFILNATFLAIFTSHSEEKRKTQHKDATNPVLFISIFLSLFLSSTLLYLGLGVSYFLNKDFHFAILVDSIVQVALLIVYIIGLVSMFLNKK